MAGRHPHGDRREPGSTGAGLRGLDDLHAIATGAPGHLAPGGLLALEVAETRAEEVAAWFRCSPLWAAVEVRPDLAGRPRCLLARAAGASPGNPVGR